MTIRIGKSILIGAEGAGKGLLMAGIVGMGYAALATAGMTADMADHANLALKIAELAEPVTSAVLNAVKAHGFGPEEGSPAVLRMGLAMFVTLPFSMAAVLSGSSLKSAAGQAREEQEETGRGTRGPAAVSGLASRLKGIVSRITTGPGRQHQELDDEQPEVETQGMR